MSPLASFTRIGTLAVLTLALGGACGGQAFTDGGNDGGTSNGGTTSVSGSTSMAGSTPKAGSHSVGGSLSMGGTGTGATSAGGVAGTGATTTGGSAGAPNEACSAPPDSGLCNAYFPSWYHDPSTGLCMPFVYGGCGGNANRYPSREDCQKACPGGAPNYDSCKVPTDCVVVGTSCCGICDAPDINAHDLVAYNRQYAGLLQCGAALDAASGAAAPVACPACAAVPNDQGTLRYFVPDCVRGECVVVDLRTSPVTACKTASDCKVRHGSSCCEGCSPGDLISVRNDGSFEQLVCGTGPIACPACAPPPFTGVTTCIEGHCGLAVVID